jgi:flagellar biosynthesis/type III secretory pathway protein FliH
MMMNQALDTAAVAQERLADNEITRILTALRAAEFKAGAAPSLTTDKSFRPRSLLEIAASVQRQAESDPPQAPTADEAQPKHQANSQTQTDGLMADGLATDETVEKTIAGQQDGAAHLSADIQATDDTTVLENEMVGLNEAGVDAQTADGDDDGLVKQQAYDCGYADGEEAGRVAALAQMKAETETAVRAELHEKLQAFDSALTALLSYDKDQIDAFSSDIQRFVLRLATQRAGIAIADLPKKFIEKIDALAEQVGRRLADAEIHLCAADIEQIRPMMDEHGASYRFVSDPTMAHGDVKLVFGGVEVEDRLGMTDTDQTIQGQHAKTQRDISADGTTADTAGLLVPDPDGQTDMS